MSLSVSLDVAASLPGWLEAAIAWLLEPLRFDFMLRGFMAGVLTGSACAVLSVFVVLRRMAFVGDALAHAILPGVVLAFLNGVNLLLGAFIAGVLAALGIGWFTREGELSEDTAIGIIFSGLFALGIALLSTARSYRDLTDILFGNILGVSRLNLWVMAAVLLIVLVVIGLAYKELVVTSFDPIYAVAIGLSPGLVRHGLLMLLVLTVVASIQTVGVVLVISLLVTPAAAASLLTRRLLPMLGLAVGLGITAAVSGLYLSYHLDVASGPSIVLTLTAFFAAAFLFAPHRGVVWKVFRPAES